MESAQLKREVLGWKVLARLKLHDTFTE